MSYFRVNTESLKILGSQIGSISDSLEQCAQDALSVSRSVRNIISNGQQVGNSVKSLSDQIDAQAKSFRQAGRTAESIAQLYASTDARVEGNSKANTDISFRDGGSKSSGDMGTDTSTRSGGSARSTENNSVPASSGMQSESQMSSNNTGGKDVSLIEDSVGVDAGLIGGSAGYGFLNYETELKSGIKGEYKNGRIDELSIGVSSEGKISVVKGEAEGYIGFAKGKVKGEVGVLSSKGEIGASLFKDGKLSPQIKAEVETEMKGVTAEGKLSVGSDDYNINAKAQGTLGYFKAEASASAGIITYEDEDTGLLKQEIGVSGKVGAEAYAAEGSVSGGLTIAGIKVKASIKGKAGGSGLKAEGRATAGGVSGELGAGLGLGVGIKFDIDWSSFKPRWPWSK